MQRLFVALELPEDVTSALQQLCCGVPGAKWRNQDQMHLTLRFIGEVDGAVARDAMEALASVEAPAFEMAIKGIGHFGDRRKPRVLWAGTDHVDELKRLAAKIERVLQDTGLEPERRKFHPHVTLAYLQGARMDDITGFEATFGGFATPAFRVEEFVLFSSYLSGEGAIYTAEAAYSLD